MLARRVGDEKLAAIGVRSRICHRYDSALVVHQMAQFELVFELAAPNRLASISNSSRISTLKNVLSKMQNLEI